MKTQIKDALIMLSIVFFSITTFATIQNTINPIKYEVNNKETTTTGVYKGHDDSGYLFVIKNEKGEEKITSFLIEDETVALSNDLDSKSVLGLMYDITYSTEENGTKTITALKVKL